MLLDIASFQWNIKRTSKFNIHGKKELHKKYLEHCRYALVCAPAIKMPYFIINFHFISIYTKNDCKRDSSSDPKISCHFTYIKKQSFRGVP